MRSESGDDTVVEIAALVIGGYPSAAVKGEAGMKLKPIAALLAALALAACATNTGAQAINDFGRFQQTEVGVTTKAQLHGIFGQPHQVRYLDASGESVWTYYQMAYRINPTTFIPFVGIATGGSDIDVTQADFYFNAAGVFQRSQRAERSRYVNQWAGIADALTPPNIVGGVEAEMQRLQLPFNQADARRAAHWADAAQ